MISLEINEILKSMDLMWKQHSRVYQHRTLPMSVYGFWIVVDPIYYQMKRNHLVSWFEL